MSNQSEQFSEIHRKNMEAAMRLAQLSIDNSQRIMQLQSELAKALFDESVANAHALATAEDPEKIVALRTRYAQDISKQLVDAAQKIASISAAARTEFSRLLTEQLASGSHEMTEALQAFIKSVPVQNPQLTDPLQEAIAGANTAFEQILNAAAHTLSGTTTKASSKPK